MRGIALALLSATVLLTTAACGSSGGPEAPRWLEEKASGLVEEFDDPSASVSYVVRPVPVVVLEGSLRCPDCSGPISERPSGSAAAIRFDPKTHVFGDWSLVDGDGCEALRALGRPYGGWCSRLQ
jgi:hypothetical protein